LVVASLNVSLYLPGCNSLKEKRQRLKSIKERLRNKYNVAVAEVGGQDLWQRCELGVVTVATDQQFANKVLSKSITLIEADQRIELIGYELEMR
jgi:hypothetical protein